MAKAATINIPDDVYEIVDDVSEILDEEAAEAAEIASAAAEDWTAERDELVATERNLDLIISQKVAEGIAAVFAKQAADAVGPPKTMRSTVYDKFVANTNNNQSRGGEVLKHYRCDSAISTKMIELDMELMDQYLDGVLEIPRNERGRKRSLEDLCVIPGQTIDWVAGHCYVYTVNQDRNIERAQQRAISGEQGGMPGIYEDTGSVVDWQCFTCQRQPKFSNEQTYVNHMNATHGASMISSAA